MKQIYAALILAGALAVSGPSLQGASPVAGRWDITVAAPHGTLIDWLGVTEKDGVFDVWYQPPGGNVFRITDFKVEGAHLSLVLQNAGAGKPALTWEVDASADGLSGTQKRGDEIGQVHGLRAPALIRPEPKAWTDPESLFHGKDLTGWVPVDQAPNHWLARNGELINESRGANLKTTRKFDDFKLHIEFNCPDDGNSGVYLRGRYEVQIEYEPLAFNPPERRIGSIYGYLTPSVELPRKPGQWESFDVTLVGRMVTVVRDGVTILDRQEIRGTTGGALDSNEGEPGPIYLQGDHTGGLRFRNIAVSVPK
ncbi:MAG: DUF1080 domain-containing protein [Bryobacteraceae bacterium]